MLFLALSLLGKRCRQTDKGCFLPPAQACLGCPPKGSKLFLDKKFNKNQGWELMLDKIVKALFRQHKHPMKNRERMRCLG